jgi:hydroxymethylpyrimidine pyrophosphatase-like HAD family hydrolase
MEKIKAVIMDIDGTLVDGKTQQIPPKTKQLC